MKLPHHGLEEFPQYHTTLKECEKQIQENDNVCSYCGQELQAIETEDHIVGLTYKIGCMHGTNSGHFTNGVKKSVYHLAEKLVLDDVQRQPLLLEGINADLVSVLSRIDTDEKFRLWFQIQVNSWCNILETISHLKKNDPQYTINELKVLILNEENTT